MRPADRRRPRCATTASGSRRRGERGYRSVAGPATAEAPFGTREVSAPVDLGVAADARNRDAERHGGTPSSPASIAPRDGIGEDGTSTTQAIAFSADGTTGFTGGTVAFGAVTAARPDPRPTHRCCPRSATRSSRRPRPPTAMGASSRSRAGAARCSTCPADDWMYPNTGLMSVLANGRFVPLRAVVWPRPNVLVGVGSAGALVTAGRDPVALDLTSDGISDDPRRELTTYDDLPVEATLLAVGVHRHRPARVHRRRPQRADRARRRAALARRAPAHRGAERHRHHERRLRRPDPAGGHHQRPLPRRRRRPVDTRRRAARRVGSRGRPAAVERVATEPGGGTVVDGQIKRDAPTAPWQATNAPLELHPVAIAAFREGGECARSSPPLRRRRRCPRR